MYVPPDPFIIVFTPVFLDKNLREIAILIIVWMAFKIKRKIKSCLSRGCSRFWTWQLHFSQHELWWLNAAEHSLADERHCNIFSTITEGFGWISQWNWPNFILRTPPFWYPERHHLVYFFVESRYFHTQICILLLMFSKHYFCDFFPPQDFTEEKGLIGILEIMVLFLIKQKTEFWSPYNFYFQAGSFWTEFGFVPVCWNAELINRETISWTTN